jgi:nucleoside phosphorylase
VLELDSEDVLSNPENPNSHHQGRSRYTIGVIVPLEEELEMLLEHFPVLEDCSTPRDFRFVVDSGVLNVTVVVAKQPDMGRTNAGRTVAELLQQYEIGLVICFGIAGGLSGDLKLGDVCYSGDILDIYDNSKTSETASGEVNTEFSPTHFETARELTTALSAIRILPKLRGLYDAWQAERAKIAESILPDSYPSRAGKEEQAGKPSTKSGTIVCGNVVKSEVFIKRLFAIDRRVLAIETESGAIFEETRSKGVPTLTIRGISDYADKGKSKLEEQTKGGMRRLAAGNAASFLKLQIMSGNLVRAIEYLKPASGLVTTQLEASGPATIVSLVDAIGEIGKDIDISLRKLSPEYRLQPNGYYLPIPRVKSRDTAFSVGSEGRIPQVEIREAINKDRVVFLNLPRTYPEQSLAWIIASDLITSVVAEKQPLPIVIVGSDLKPPRSGLERLSGGTTQKWESLEGGELVFIIDEPVVQSKTRLNYLIEQVDLYPNARFIFLIRDTADAIRHAELSSELKGKTYNVCEISFVEIAHFVQKNFEMTGSEAEVVALRLSKIFDDYDLSAHPTYFAGIPKETLSALLQANRRAELIQLAVDGFLSFVVAGDNADIKLSRTTRSRFLRRLVSRIRAGRMQFDQPTLIKYTSEFAREFDFDIDPIAFIATFVDQGILHFESGLVRFSLPFIEHYLLALELTTDADLALEYFNFGQNDFDFPTFDLYSELGPAHQIVARELQVLKSTIQNVTKGGAVNQILLTDEIRPTMLNEPRQLAALQARLNTAVSAVVNGKADTKEKQRLLDISDTIKDKVAEQSRQASNAVADAQPFHSIDHTQELYHIWMSATILLGSGSEHLNAGTKKLLIEDCLRLANIILNEWTRLITKIDFGKIKAEVTNNAMIEKLRALNGHYDDESLTKLIHGIMDILEFSILSTPFRAILDQLCEQARHKVLASTIEKAHSDDVLEQVIRGIWLSDIDSRRGSALLQSSIRDIKAASFLRYNIITHLLARVFWNHWDKADRLNLLNAAEQCLRSLPGVSGHPDRSRLLRLIENSIAPNPLKDLPSPH